MNTAIIGAGGHAKVVLDALFLSEEFEKTSTWLIDPGKANDNLMGLPILSSLSELEPGRFIVAIGNNRARERCFNEAKNSFWKPFSLMHPSAVVSPNCLIGEGTFVGPNAVVNANARIAENVIVNSGAIIEHDCRIGAHSHIAPRSVLGGQAKAGAGVLIGIGSTVCPSVTIGDWSTLGAGSVLLKSLETGLTAIGVPASEKTVGSRA